MRGPFGICCPLEAAAATLALTCRIVHFADPILPGNQCMLRSKLSELSPLGGRAQQGWKRQCGRVQRWMSFVSLVHGLH